MTPSFRARLAAWFRAAWYGREHRVLAEYRAIGQLALTDIALRGGVFSAPARTAGDTFGDGVNEGRRLLALEIIGISDVDPRELSALMSKAKTNGDRP